MWIFVSLFFKFCAIFLFSCWNYCSFNVLLLPATVRPLVSLWFQVRSKIFFREFIRSVYGKLNDLRCCTYMYSYLYVQYITWCREEISRIKRVTTWENNFDSAAEHVFYFWKFPSTHCSCRILLRLWHFCTYNSFEMESSFSQMYTKWNENIFHGAK